MPVVREWPITHFGRQRKLVAGLQLLNDPERQKCMCFSQVLDNDGNNDNEILYYKMHITLYIYIYRR